MATAKQFLAAHQTEVRPKPRLFFPAMALFAIAIVLLAFIPEYVGHQHKSLPVAWAVRIHAAIMTAWIGVFFVQAYLGATRRIAQHRRIGNFGIAVGWLALLSMIFVQGRFLILNPLPEDISILIGYFRSFTSIQRSRSVSSGLIANVRNPTGTSAS
jgi:hypothetical protein